MILSYLKSKTTGLANLGNTCFLNTCLQILAHTFELNDLLTEKNGGRKKDDTHVWVQWRELLVEMWKRRSVETVVLYPHKFVYYLQKTAQKTGHPLFTGWVQNDFVEFLHFMVGQLHSATSHSVDMVIRGDVSNDVDKMALECYTMMKREYTKEYSDVMTLFQGVLVSEIRSVDDPTKVYSIKAELFFTLDLPLLSEPTRLADLLTAFTGPETLQGDNAWFNEATGVKETVSKRLLFWSLPPVLVVSLKRFDGNGKKNGVYVSYPVQGLDMSPYVCGYRRESLVYDLYGVACHLGGTQGGHYFALVQNAKTGQWFCYNDERITEIGSQQEVVTNQAYCLFYRRRL